MKSIFISDLSIGEDLENEPFLVQNVVNRTTKDDRPFLLFNLADKTGQCHGVFWDVPEYINKWLRSGMIVLVTGRIVNYKNETQVSATDINECFSPDMRDFLPTSQRPREEMIAELNDQISLLSDPWQTIVSHILLEESFLPRFAEAPAARGMHHAYIGGLLEHTLSMAQIARMLAEHYPHVNEDLLVAGTLLHDMGKVHEYSLAGEFSFSDDGRLVGHIVRAITMVETAVAQLDNISVEDTRELVHLIASHHGRQEWGSPVVPKTLEAILLHQIDLLDSRIQGFFDHINNDDSGGDWTSKSSMMFQTELRRPL